MNNTDIIKYLESNGCKYLSTEQGMVFFKDKNSETQGASEYSIERCILLLNKIEKEKIEGMIHGGDSKFNIEWIQYYVDFALGIDFIHTTEDEHETFLIISLGNHALKIGKYVKYEE